jgi:uncharacterized membrane protein YhhN
MGDPAWDLVLAALEVPAVVALLWMRHRDREWGVYVAKPLASALFLGVAFLQTPGDPSYALAVRVGLVLCLVGDLLLMADDKRVFAAGLGVFLLAHVAYAGAAWPLVGVAGLGGASALVGLAVGGAVAEVCRRWVWGGAGRLRGPAALYGVALAVMTWLALSAWLVAPRDPGRILLGLGGLLFCISDAAVARERFAFPGISNRLWGLPTYYGGQVLLALSVGWVGR